MTSSLLAKSTFGVVGLGTVISGSIYFGKDLVFSNKPKTKTSIEELIDKFNSDKRFASVSATDHWKAAWQAYIEDNKSSEKDAWNIDGWIQTTISEETVKVPESFIQACEMNRSKEVLDKNDVLYSQVVKYCTRDALVRDLINETGDKTLLQKDGNFRNDAHWKAAWDLYKTDNSDTNKWNLTNWPTIKGQAEVPDSFVDECVKKSQTPEYRLEQSIYTEVLKYCTKDA
ncbi:hypothetical protein MHC_01125 [Mycoplasma haemocanis str. Illinois]|uniref:Uncharacterized protein n=1 Tax=Mycoplasma haemocanis (strain Illinois) TaxID=1111676 RepID=H6N619_MYCHN|nr:hypothetical protein [Mycoplasma haemocanis]AEW45091.1 hypothetical protein MHC_01125 [Mycoplasma haemocanis str. Illinois]